MEYQTLSLVQQQLLDAAEEALTKAYNPYSRFSVGAALLSRSQEIITGANVENAAYGSCLCAERAALVRANAMGFRRFEAIAIIGRAENFEAVKQVDMVTSPCGACRQMLFEACQIAEHDLKVIMATGDKSKVVVMPISELLPHGFGPDQLGIDISEFRKESL
ncbi:MAG: cytidine deaminase [SAR324 cluster bacterium]|nr:cytidine deaminase [SAR324 cluster bacterium]